MQRDQIACWAAGAWAYPPPLPQLIRLW